jgi:uncharacterized membrane protein
VTSSTAPRVRFDRLDALRGAAMVWMAAFHFSFDLNHLGWLDPRQNFYHDPFWTLQRTAIVSLFLICVGGGQAVATAQGQTAARFWRRWGQVAAGALLVSAGSWWMFPHSWISFGVLHGIAAMLLVVRALAPVAWRRPWLPWALATVALALPLLVAHPFFDTRATNWVGLVTHKPVTEDYVPLLPWLGVVWLGFGLVRADLARRRAWLSAPLPRPLAPLAALGRWPLSFYLLHQPVLIGALTAVGWAAARIGG